MSNYFLIEISEGDSKITGSAVYGYDTSNEAVADFFSKKGTAMESDLYDFELIMVLDKDNSRIKELSYYKKGVEHDPTALYMLEVKTTTEGVETKNISNFTDPVTAVARLSKKMGAAMKDSTCASEQLLIFDKACVNDPNWSEVYTAPTPTPEPEPEPEPESEG